jgi:acetyl-CoA carboxylase carboxyltransferase component
MAAHFEIDDVIDPAETRDRIVATLRSQPPVPRGERRRTMIDSW